VSHVGETRIKRTRLSFVSCEQGGKNKNDPQTNGIFWVEMKKRWEEKTCYIRQCHDKRNRKGEGTTADNARGDCGEGKR